MNVVVTGASSGIGKEIYDYYVAKGSSVIGVSRRGPDLSVDLSVPSGVHYTLFGIGDRKIDIWINCAGVLLLEEKDENACTQMVTLNMMSVWAFLSYANDYMIPGGSIINIASVSGLRASPDTPLYAATKAAVISMTQSYAMLYAGIPIRVNAISPGFFDTNLVDGETPVELIDTIPMQREAKTLEIIPVIEMIEKAEYMTGANIIIDGGSSL